MTRGLRGSTGSQARAPRLRGGSPRNVSSPSPKYLRGALERVEIDCNAVAVLGADEALELGVEAQAALDGRVGYGGCGGLQSSVWARPWRRRGVGVRGHLGGAGSQRGRHRCGRSSNGRAGRPFDDRHQERNGVTGHTDIHCHIHTGDR